MKKLSTTLLAVAIASVAFLTACEEAEQIISVIGIELNQTSATMTVGTTLTLVPNVSPANASNPALRWISSDSTVASVANGTITAIAPGNANIMAISIDGGLIATCAVTVIPETAPNVPVTNVSLNSTGGLLTVGKSAMLIATVWPENATNQTVTWTSNNPAVASVVNGLVTAISAGTATITVTTEDGNFTATFTVAINAATPDIPDISVTGVSLNWTDGGLWVGENLTLIATVWPENATNQTVTWASNNPAVASVVNGLVTAISAGTATITVTTEDGNFTATFMVVINAAAADISVTGVSLNQTSATLEVGQNFTLTATIFPENATNQNLTWTSSDNTIATVANGVVIVTSAGTATITVTTEDGNFTATSVVTATISATGVTLNQATATLTAGENITLTATVLPTYATNRNVTWTSNNPAVASVVNGVVTAISAGTATITVTTQDGNFTATSVVTVNPATTPVISVTLSHTSAIVTAGESLTLTATVLPANATNQNVTWTSNNTSVATVSNNGLVTAISAGTATITVTTQDGNFTATGVVTVNPATVPVTGVTLNQTTATLTAGESLTLTATVLPANATNQNVTWTSNNTAVATVNNNGVVTAVSVGTATITVATEDGNFTATSAVTVITPLPPTTNCNQNPLPFTLGTPYFATNQTWTIPGTGGRPTQEWSDAVRAPGCDKTTFAGGSFQNANTDCRNATNGFSGHYFTWCMVMRFAHLLCPPAQGWRVPTQQDFIELDLNLGGNGINRSTVFSDAVVNGFTLAQQLVWYVGSAGTGTFAVNRGGT